MPTRARIDGNTYKGPYIAGIDPETGWLTRVLLSAMHDGGQVSYLESRMLIMLRQRNGEWGVKRDRRQLDDQRTEHTLTYTDPKTGLEAHAARAHNVYQ